MLRDTKHCRRWYCALAVPIIPVEAAIMAAGLPLKELSLVGLEAQFIVFLGDFWYRVVVFWGGDH